MGKPSPPLPAFRFLNRAPRDTQTAVVSSVRLAALLALASVALGCTGRDLRDVLVEWKPQVEPVLGKLGAIRAHATSAPPLTADGFQLGAEHRSDATPSDVAQLFLEDLADPKELGNVPIRIAAVSSSTSTDLIARCASALETHREPFDPRLHPLEPDPMSVYTAADVLKKCAAVRFLFVIKTTAYAAPSALRPGSPGCPEREAATPTPAAATPSNQAAPTAPSASDPASSPAASTAPVWGPPCRVYDAGFVHADVLVYEALTARPLGGFRVDAESPKFSDVGEVSEPRNVLKSALGLAFERAYSWKERGAEKP